jgi:hypothetical protein
MLYDKFPVSVRDLTAERIRNGDFENIFPALYKLKKVIENNSEHDNESVFDHTIRDLYMLEQIRKFCPKQIENYLNQQLDENTQWDTLYIGATFHDIGKSLTMIKRKSTTNYPEHEKVGSEIVGPMLDQIFLSDLEKKIVTEIIRYHGDLNNIVHPSNKFLDAQYNGFKSKRESIIIELNMFAFAETLSSEHLKKNNPDEYRFRTEFYKNNLLSY